MTRSDAIRFLMQQPYKLGHLVGFDRLTELHNSWIVDMAYGTEDATLQGHRESYKTTCLSITLAVLLVLLPNIRVLFMRKTDADVREVVAQVAKILESQQMGVLVQAIYGVPLKLTKRTATEISTNLTTDPRGSAQLTAMGTGGSMTGKHFDRIFTDDIINLEDRQSRAERERIKLIYQELQNLRNRGGRIYNTGTPWHKEDAFSIMPSPRRYDCYSTGLMTEDQIEQKRESMTASLFAANYELKHIADDDVIFTGPKWAEDDKGVCDGYAHVDASYGGSDGTAFTICRKVEGKYYVYGKLWHRHVDDCMGDIKGGMERYRATRIYCEDNADKGYLARALQAGGVRVASYHESTNKFYKITSYLKAAWEDVYFVPGTDQEYIDQICDYNDTAEHDDAPDSLASLIRIRYFGKDKPAPPPKKVINFEVEREKPRPEGQKKVRVL